MGEPDELQKIIIDEKDAWLGSQSIEGDIAVNNPDLFGGIKKEGGAVGTVRFLPGAADQVLPDDLAQKLGRASGAVTRVSEGLLRFSFQDHQGAAFIGERTSPFLPGVWARLKRILKRSDGSEQWYVEKAQINSCLIAAGSEAIIRVELFGVVGDNFPNLGYFISGFPGGFNDGRQAQFPLEKSKPPQRKFST